MPMAGRYKRLLQRMQFISTRRVRSSLASQTHPAGATFTTHHTRRGNAAGMVVVLVPAQLRDTTSSSQLLPA